MISKAPVNSGVDVKPSLFCIEQYPGLSCQLPLVTNSSSSTFSPARQFLQEKRRGCNFENSRRGFKSPLDINIHALHTTDSACCHIPLPMLSCQRVPLRYTHNLLRSVTQLGSYRYTSSNASTSTSTEDFNQFAGDLQRRRRRTDQKRRQHGASFIDHTVITVRGGELHVW
jgi:hypothetical protein